MIKILILIFVVTSVMLVVYYQSINNLSTNNVEVDKVEKGDGSVPNTDTQKLNKQTGSSNILDLSSKGITKVPEYVFSKTDIEKLDLSNNIITGSLQAEIRHLQNLKVLDLSNNDFTGVPAEIGQLKNLEVLDLSNNRITGLPLELGNLTHLKVLNIKGNNYSETDLNLIKDKLSDSTIIQVD